MPKTSINVQLLGYSFVLVMVAIFWAVSSHFEARTYNRLTGSNVSTWDAMFVQLRVVGQPQVRIEIE